MAARKNKSTRETESPETEPHTEVYDKSYVRTAQGKGPVEQVKLKKIISHLEKEEIVPSPHTMLENQVQMA